MCVERETDRYRYRCITYILMLFIYMYTRIGASKILSCDRQRTEVSSFKQYIKASERNNICGATSLNIIQYFVINWTIFYCGNSCNHKVVKYFTMIEYCTWTVKWYNTKPKFCFTCIDETLNMYRWNHELVSYWTTNW